MIALASLLLAQLVVPSGEGMPAAQRIELLARSITADSTSLIEIFEDAEVRALMKRVGLDAGCPIARQASRTAAGRFEETLAPFAKAAIRETIPLERLEEFRPVSFLAGGAGGYRSRVARKFEVLAAEPLFQARAEARRGALAGLADLPDFTPGPDTAAPIDPFFESAFGAKAERTWDSAPLMSLACLQRAGPPPGLTIEHGGQTYPPGVGEQ